MGSPQAFTAVREPICGELLFFRAKCSTLYTVVYKDGIKTNFGGLSLCHHKDNTEFGKPAITANASVKRAPEKLKE